MEEIIFEPSILKWAREKRFGPKIEVLENNLCKSSNLSVDLIKEWEAGTKKPNFSEVKKLAEIYKRSLAVFFLDSIPEENKNIPDLRTIGSKDNKSLSPEALLVIRKARRIQETAQGLFEELNQDLNFKYPKHQISENPEKLADKIREDLSVSVSDQFKARKYEDFFEYLRLKIENTGVLTLKSGLHDSFPTEDCRAFSFVDQQPYLILVNNKDTEGAKNFSLMHEFAHILLREGGICNNFNSFGNHKEGIKALEVFCNRFAASFLVPKDDFFMRLALKNSNSISMENIDQIVCTLASDFKVSRFVILRRLSTFGLITPEVYKKKEKVWREDKLPTRSEGGSFSLKTTLNKNGKKFSSLVLEAYKKNKITYTNFSDYIGLKTKHLPGFQKLLNTYAK